MSDRPTPNPRDVARLHARAVSDLPLLSGRLTVEALHDAVTRSVVTRFAGEHADRGAVSTYVASLHAADLGLATLCDGGDDVGWSYLVTTYRPVLYRAAASLLGGPAAGRDLADALWAELYGVGRTRASVEPGTERRSLLRYFQGRSTLSTWLRSVLARRHVDVIRAQHRHAPLDRADHDAGPEPDPIPTTSGTNDPDRAEVVRYARRGLRDAVGSLEARDRLRLAYYHVQGLTLAEIGRLLGEHEATTSRKLARTRKQLKATVERLLQERHRMTAAEIALCYEYLMEDRSVDVGALIQPAGR